MERGLPEIVNEVATQGTRVHLWVRKAAEQLWKGALIQDIDLSELSEKEQELVRRCLSVLSVPLSHAQSAAFEEPGELRGADGELILTTAGTDAFLKFEDHYEIFDWKCGWNTLARTSAFLQGGSLYAIACQRYGSKPGKVTFYQARQDTTYVHQFEEKHVAEIIGGIQRLIAKGNAGGYWKLLEPSAESCTYCRARGMCPAARSRFEALAVRESPKSLSLMPTEKLAEYRAMVPVVEGIAKLVKDECNRRALEEGEKIPGFKLTERTGTRYFYDNHELFDYLLGTGQMTTADVLALAKFPVNKVVDALAESVEGKTMAERRRVAEDQLAWWIRRGDSKRFLVKGDE